MLHVIEQFNSIQGEGPRVGEPTHFIRFAGCNLKCPGWPCDTQYAIDPKQYPKEKLFRSPLEVFIQAERAITNGMNVCLTGGEPCLQNAEDLECLLDLIKSHTGVFVEAFTNGTLLPPPQIMTRINSFVIDWKLPGSGIVTKNAWLSQLKSLRPSDAIKFTIKDRADYDTAVELYWRTIKPTTLLTHRSSRKQAPVVFYGPVWGVIEVSELVEWVLKDGLPWRLNTQVHKYIWSPDTKGV